MSASPSVGGWDLRGRPLPRPSSLTSRPLGEIAVMLGAKHVWGLAPDPMQDVVAGADLAAPAINYLAPPVGPAAAPLWLPSGQRTYIPPPETGAAAVHLHRGAARSATWLCRPFNHPGASSNALLLGLGDYNSVHGWLTVHLNTELSLRSPDGAVAPLGVSRAAWLASELALVTLAWDPSALQSRAWVRLDGGAERTGVLAQPASGSAPGRVRLGYPSSTFSMQQRHQHLAIWDGPGAVAARLTLYDALGWEAP